MVPPPWYVLFDGAAPAEYCVRRLHGVFAPERAIAIKQLKGLGQLVERVLRDCEILDEDQRSVTKGARIAWEEATMYHICTHFVEPLTEPHKCSFVELVADRAQRPMWFVSHWWGNRFKDTLLCLEFHVQQLGLFEHTPYWICTMADNQHDLAAELGNTIEQSPFVRALELDECLGAVMVMDKDVTPFVRSWCTWETRTVIKLLKRLDIVAVVPPGSLKRDGKTFCEYDGMPMLLHDLGGGKYEERGVFFPPLVAARGSRVDIARATASNKRDQAMIKAGIARSGGAQVVNKEIRRVFGNKALYSFAYNGNAEEVGRLLREGVCRDIDEVTKEGFTPLIAAAEQKRADCLQALLDARADMERSTTWGATPTFLSALKGHQDCLQRLLHARADLDACAYQGQSPAYAAAANGKDACLQLLLKARAGMTLVTESGNTPVHAAAVKGCCSCLRLLATARAEVDRQNAAGNRPIYEVVRRGHSDALQVLVEVRADLNLPQSSHSQTPVFAAARNASVQCLRILIAEGADIHRASKGGSGPVHAAAAQALDSGDRCCLDILLEARADPNVEADDGKTALSIMLCAGATAEPHAELRDTACGGVLRPDPEKPAGAAPVLAPASCAPALLAPAPLAPAPLPRVLHLACQSELRRNLISRKLAAIGPAFLGRGYSGDLSVPVSIGAKLSVLVGPSSVLIVGLPLGVVSMHCGWSSVATFFLVLFAFVPLGKIIGDVAEELASSLRNDKLRILFLALFGNVVHMVLIAHLLQAGFADVTKALLVGTVLLCMLLVLGTSLLTAGCTKRARMLVVEPSDVPLLAGRAQSEPLQAGALIKTSQVILSCLSLDLTTVFDMAAGVGHTSDDRDALLSVSRVCSGIIMSTYAASIAFESFVRAPVEVEEYGEEEHEDDEAQLFTCGEASCIMVIMLVGLWFSSDLLVCALKDTVGEGFLGAQFIGVVLLPIAVCMDVIFASIRLAFDKKVKLSVAIAFGSVTQVSLFVAPFAVLLGWVIGQGLDLNFGLFNVIMMTSSVLAGVHVVLDAAATWLVGYMLCAAYLTVVFLYWRLPDGTEPRAG